MTPFKVFSTREKVTQEACGRSGMKMVPIQKNRGELPLILLDNHPMSTVNGWSNARFLIFDFV
jgi:hypothetical protein